MLGISTILANRVDLSPPHHPPGNGVSRSYTRRTGGRAPPRRRRPCFSTTPYASPSARRCWNACSCPNKRTLVPPQPSPRPPCRCHNWLPRTCPQAPWSTSGSNLPPCPSSRLRWRPLSGGSPRHRPPPPIPNTRQLAWPYPRPCHFWPQSPTSRPGVRKQVSGLLR